MTQADANRPNFLSHEAQNLTIFERAANDLKTKFGQQVYDLLQAKNRDIKVRTVDVARRTAQENIQSYPDDYEGKHFFSVVQAEVYQLLYSELNQIIQMEDAFLRTSTFNFHSSLLHTQKGREVLDQRIVDLENIITAYKKGSEATRAKIKDTLKLPHLGFKLNLAYRSLLYSDIPKTYEKKGPEEEEKGLFFGMIAKETNGVYEDDYFAILQLLLHSLKLERDFNTRVPTVGFPQPWRNTETGVYDIQVLVSTNTLGFSIGINDIDKMRKVSLESPSEGQSVGYTLALEYHKRFRPTMPYPPKFRSITQDEFQKGVQSGIPIFLAYRSFLHYVGEQQRLGYTIDLRSTERFPSETEKTTIFWPMKLGVKQQGKIFSFVIHDNTPYLTGNEKMFSSKERFFAPVSRERQERGLRKGLRERMHALSQTRQRNSQRKRIADAMVRQVDEVFGRKRAPLFDPDEPVPMI